MNEFIVPLVVCVNMSDFLKISLEKNRKLFKHYFVVTSDNDTDTIQLCKDFDIDVIIYNDFWKNNSKFNKSGAILYAQTILHKRFPDKWILLLDCDIILPLNFDYYKDESKINILDKTALYSILRFDLNTPDDYKKLNLKKYRSSTHDGYFQMYFDKTKYYEDFSENAAYCDLWFRDLFKKKKLLKLYVLHIGEAGSNWNGRNCKIWK